MKRLLSSLLILMLGTSAWAQYDTTSVLITDQSGNPIPGTRVFWYPDGALYSPPGTGGYNLMAAQESRTTQSNGVATFVYASVNPTDTVAYATLDCNGNIASGGQIAQFLNDTVTLPISCAPTACQTVPWVQYDSTGQVRASSVYMRDSSYLSSIPGAPVFDWTFNNNAQSGVNVTYQPASSGDSVVYCHRLYSGCAWECDTLPPFQPSGSNLNCQADFFVDTVNSLNFQGQIILGENSSSSPGQVVQWNWDFGDGTQKSGQYPQHTYNNPTGVYNICLTITAVSGNDTCYSTFCDTLGIDSTGNLVYKDGFTVNVIDPNTFSLEGLNLQQQWSLFPNPTSSKANLRWPEELEASQVRVYTSSGQLVVSQPLSGAEHQLPELSAGAYLVQLETAYGKVQKRLLVR